MQFPAHFDVLVIGGGHAGTEACLAAARMGARTLLLTQNIETLGQMSCNPSIGGIGKGHLVKEIDALGGAMARATDEAGIQFRILNGSKGPAVQATRAQADRALYRAAIRRRLENQPGLWIFQQPVDELIIEGERVTGAITQSGIRFGASTVVLTAGTFLNGLIHVGLQHHPGGRAGDAPALSLAARLKELALPQGRLKTGTPPRLDARSIDFSRLEEQRGDSDPIPVFSYLGSAAEHPEQRPCWITHTNEGTHDIIRANLARSPMYSGVIEGIGPRYCPSVEDKIHRFAGKSSHQIFLEPEGLSSNEIYPNGISTSLPFDVQVQLVRSIKGLENAHIVRPGYAIEYDYYDPRGLHRSLETRAIQNLFFAGQINGSTGYEEAAAQGLLAGINAARRAQGREAWCPRRDEAYLGVLVDDLTTQGVSEPYRMFTSRAEYRLSLREDNADERLTPTGRELGCVDEHRWTAYARKRDAVAHELERLKSTWVHPRSLDPESTSALLGKPLVRESTLYELLKRPQLGYADLAQLRQTDGSATLAPAAPALDAAVIQQLEIAARYEGYIARQRVDIARQESHETTRIPSGFDYATVRGLSIEVRQKLQAQRPDTLGQAARISGVTPAAISLLMVFLKRWNQQHGAAPGTDRTTMVHADARPDSGAAGAAHQPLCAPQLAALAQELDLELTPQQSAALVDYAQLLRRWNRVHNLTAVDGNTDLLTHHLLDCLAIVRPIERALARFATGLLPGRPVHFLDAGSGAGLPGIPLAVARPHWHGLLVDAVQKKCAFLQQAQLELRLNNIEVRHARLESASLGTHDIIVARAFSSLRDFVTLTRPLLRPNGLWIAMKGRIPSGELAELPEGVEAVDTSTLRVPQLAEQRHLVVLRPLPAGATRPPVPMASGRAAARRTPGPRNR